MICKNSLMDTQICKCPECYSPPGGKALASVSGCAAHSVSERLSALRFARKWLWENTARMTTGSEWPSDYLIDAAGMMVDYKKRQND
jgi:hypothetical protein